MPKYIGLSLSFCVSDILQGKVALANVEKIIASTAMRTKKDWDHVIDQYCETYWQDDPAKARQIVTQLRNSNRIEQPRLQGRSAHNIASGHWKLNGKVVRL